MVNVIADHQEIKRLHRVFHRKIDIYFKEKIDCWVGHPGGSFPDTVRYSPDLDIWISVQNLTTRYWNAFGIGRPKEDANNSLVGEINFPRESINRRVAAVFAIEDNGDILVLHRGKIGGGKPGIGKRLFMDNCRTEKILAIDGSRVTEFCLVGELESIYFPQQISNFISEIYRIKSLNNEANVLDFGNLMDFEYTDERSGRIISERSESFVIERIHGVVVNALARQLENRGLQIGNDRNRDLFIHNKRYITTLFEVKTSSSTQCLYAAIGQLHLYSIPIPNAVRLVAVLPDKLSRRVAKKFSSLGIDILYYNWYNNEVNFINIDRILR